MWSRRPGFTFYLEQWYWASYPFSIRVRHRHILKHWIPCSSRGVKVIWFPLSRWGGDLWLSLGSPQGIQISLHLVTWNTSLNLSHCSESPPSFESGLSRYIPLETESTESLSPKYCWGKSPLEVLVENWLTSSVKDRESALILRWYVVHGTFFTLLC